MQPFAVAFEHRWQSSDVTHVVTRVLSRNAGAIGWLDKVGKVRKCSQTEKQTIS